MSVIVAQIKNDLGSDAVILHTRKKIKGGIWGFFGREVIEVLAGLDINVEVTAPAKRETDPAEVSYAPSAAARNRPEEKVKDFTEELSNNGGFAHSDVEEVEGPDPSASFPLGPASILKKDVNGDVVELRSELRELQKTVGRIARRMESGKPADSAPPQDRSPALAYLAAQEVADDVAADLVATAGLVEDFGASEEEIIERLVAALADELNVTGQIKLSSGKTKSKPKSVAFVGPTGVGKTTTIAKLAARFALGKHKKVALITADFFRIGAVRQLKTYAALTGVPLDVVHTSEELVEAIEAHADKDLILIDTAGHSQNNAQAMNDLSRLFSETQIDEYQLVLSATAKLADLIRIKERFGVLPVSALVLTKLDESITYGPLISLLHTCDMPVSYVTDGQRVPEDMQVAKSGDLAKKLLIGGE